LLFETVRHWAHQNAAHTFNLGGGVGGKSDSLFQFKAHFSRQRYEFVTWRWIVAAKAYRDMSLQKQLWNSERGLKASSASFFPAYRCPAEPYTVPAALSASAPSSDTSNQLLPVQNG
jgi:hypothetical protein